MLDRLVVSQAELEDLNPGTKELRVADVGEVHELKVVAVRLPIEAEIHLALAVRSAVEGDAVTAAQLRVVAVGVKGVAPTHRNRVGIDVHIGGQNGDPVAPREGMGVDERVRTDVLHVEVAGVLIAQAAIGPERIPHVEADDETVLAEKIDAGILVAGVEPVGLGLVTF